MAGRLYDLPGCDCMQCKTVGNHLWKKQPAIQEYGGSSRNRGGSGVLHITDCWHWRQADRAEGSVCKENNLRVPVSGRCMDGACAEGKPASSGLGFKQLWEQGNTWACKVGVRQPAYDEQLLFCAGDWRDGRHTEQPAQSRRHIPFCVCAGWGTGIRGLRAPFLCGGRICCRDNIWAGTGR